MTDNEIPTRQFRISGKKGKFSVSKKPVVMVDMTEKFEGFWNMGKGGFSCGYGFSRVEALENTMKNMRRI